MILTYEQAFRLHAALTGMADKEMVWEDDKTAYAMAVSASRLAHVPKLVQKKRRELQKEIFGHDQPIQQGDPALPRLGELNDRMEEFFATELPEDIKVLRVTRAALKPKENKLPVATLLGLAPMIEGFEEV